jgi:hypothetical protein
VLEKDGLRINLFQNEEFAEKDHPEFRLVTENIEEVYERVSKNFLSFTPKFKCNYFKTMECQGICCNGRADRDHYSTMVKIILKMYFQLYFLYIYAMKKLILKYHYFVLGLIGFVLSSCNTRKFKVWVGTNNEQKIYNLKYGEHQRQKMDIFLPSDYPENSPVVLLIHGGAWTLGKKEHMIQIQKMLFKNNIPSINMNYRLVSKSKKITTRNSLKISVWQLQNLIL